MVLVEDESLFVDEEIQGCAESSSRRPSMMPLPVSVTGWRNPRDPNPELASSSAAKIES